MARIIIETGPLDIDTVRGLSQISPGPRGVPPIIRNGETKTLIECGRLSLGPVVRVLAEHNVNPPDGHIIKTRPYDTPMVQTVYLDNYRDLPIAKSSSRPSSFKESSQDGSFALPSLPDRKLTPGEARMLVYQKLMETTNPEVKVPLEDALDIITIGVNDRMREINGPKASPLLPCDLVSIPAIPDPNYNFSQLLAPLKGVSEELTHGVLNLIQTYGSEEERYQTARMTLQDRVLDVCLDGQKTGRFISFARSNFLKTPSERSVNPELVPG